jgi:hypothetical protein
MRCFTPEDRGRPDTADRQKPKGIEARRQHDNSGAGSHRHGWPSDSGRLCHHNVARDNQTDGLRNERGAGRFFDPASFCIMFRASPGYCACDDANRRWSSTVVEVVPVTPNRCPNITGLVPIQPRLADRCGTDSSQTLRWREKDSNPRSPVRETFFSNPLIKWQRAAYNELCDPATSGA